MLSKLAGLPKPVVRRAEQLLNEYEKMEESAVQPQNVKFETAIEKRLAEIDTDSLSPVEALMKIYELKKYLEQKAISKT